MNAPPPVRVVIDRLVLHGVDRADAAAVQRALAAELSLRLAAGGAPAGGFERARLDIAPVADPAALGREAAAALGRSLLADSASSAVSARPLPPPATVSPVAPGVQRLPMDSPEREVEWADDEELDAGMGLDLLGPRKRRRRSPGPTYRELQRQHREEWDAKHPKPAKLKGKHKKIKGERKKRQKRLSRDLRWNRKNDSRSMSVAEAKEIVAEIAAERFAGNLDAAYEFLKDDPKLWAPGLPQASVKSPHNKSHMKSYIYLPSVDRDVAVDKTWTFDVEIPVTTVFPGTDGYATGYYDKVSFDDLIRLGAFDAEEVAEILLNIRRSGVTVTLQATMTLIPKSESSNGPLPPPQSLEVAAGRILEDTSEKVTDATTWDVPVAASPADTPPAVSSGALWPCHLTGSVRALGSFRPPPEMTESHIGATKKYAVGNRVK